MDTGGIAVIKHGDIRCEAFDEPYLRFRQSRTSACYYVLDARLMHGYHIHLTLYEVAHVGP